MASDNDQSVVHILFRTDPDNLVYMRGVYRHEEDAQSALIQEATKALIDGAYFDPDKVPADQMAQEALNLINNNTFTMQAENSTHLSPDEPEEHNNGMVLSEIACDLQDQTDCVWCIQKVKLL